MRPGLLAFLVIGLLVAADEPKDKAPEKDKDKAAAKDTVKDKAPAKDEAKDKAPAKDEAKDKAPAKDEKVKDKVDKDSNKDKDKADKDSNKDKKASKDKDKAKDKDKKASKDKAKPAKSDRDHFQGTWMVESLTVNGQKVPADLMKGLVVVVEGDKLVLKPGLDVYFTSGGAFQFRKGNPKGNQYAIKLTPGDKMKNIDLKIGENPARKGIYELKGKTLKIAYRPRGDRPADFTSKAGNQQTVFVLKKEK